MANKHVSLGGEIVEFHGRGFATEPIPSKIEIYIPYGGSLDETVGECRIDRIVDRGTW